jgi:RHS repeat-associated protein
MRRITHRFDIAFVPKSLGVIAVCAVAATVAGAQTLPPPPTSPTPVIKYEYDAEGNPTKTLVAPSTRAYATKHEYDSLGLRKKTTDAKSGLTQFGYDLQGQLTSVTDPRQLVTQYQPTGLGDVKQLVSPDTGTADSTFDAAGNLRTRTDARGVLASYSYDELNRASQVVYSKSGSTSRTVSWTYDQTGASFGYGVGRLTTAATPDASTTFRYDALGRVTMTVQSSAVGNPLVINTGYDDAGHVTSLTYPSGRIINFSWSNGQPTAVSIKEGSTTTPVLDQIAMSAFGPVQGWVWRLGAARPHERVYDTNGRLVRHPLGVLVRDITYDDADRISKFSHYTAATAQTATAYDQSFSYDELSRLTNSVTASKSWGYTYDANSNRTLSPVGLPSPAGVTISSTSNQMEAMSARSGRSMFLRAFDYDEVGNTVGDQGPSSSANYTATYSLEGRLAAMAQGSSVGVDFGYDAMGRRVTRGQWMGSPSNPRAYTLYAYDQHNHLIGEYKADGTLITEYVWLGDTPVAVIKPDPNNAAAIQVYAIHADHLDTPRVILDASGQVRWRWMGEPFGASSAEEQPTAGQPALQQNLRFPGQQYESFGGRHYNHFRDYDPTTGRYVQSDPIGLAGGINTYAYVNSRPTMRTDSMGLLDAPPLDPNGPPDLIPKPPDWPVPMGPNGSRCTLPEHNALQATVDLVCSTRRGCNQNQSCPELQENLSRARACYEARRQINNQCFNGGDLTHRVEQEKALASVNNCLYWLNRRQCFVNCEPPK